MQKTTFQSKSRVSNLSPGTTFTGKWNRNPYQIIKKLGNGANGTVYLVATRLGERAIKIGENKMSLTSEVNVLKHFSSLGQHTLCPVLLDVDDLEIAGETYPFFCMEYLHGDSLLSFTRKKGQEWVPILLVQLLGDLDRFHQAGWVFGDLKPDNIIVTGPPMRVRLFDVGGTTKMGRSIKEYTEFYDRGYWGLGDRKADVGYDLFAVAMMFIETVYPHRFQKASQKKQHLDDLMEKVTSASSLRPYKKVIYRALTGKYSDAQWMKKEIMTVIEKGSTSQAVSSKRRSRPVSGRSNGIKEKKKPSYRTELALTGSFLFLSSILYLVGQII
ncbi:protein kinase family protein [Aliibacillus thermotolerans]|uniref:non-specific serine/threonine protein kinase n=1 Tax=Aliibacillus thermotolerans TaxID=1834418 RepID=A0ABW0UAP0_9BACI|nr:protein kinase family protein [Aliibacillus thermotolerans]MDA3128843.1 protein kinase family protein [Aliibacillus thermotolerans]